VWRGALGLPARRWRAATGLLTALDDRGDAFRFLVRDRAGQLTTAFDAVMAIAGIDNLKIPPRCPRVLLRRTLRPHRQDRDEPLRDRRASAPGAGRRNRASSPARSGSSIHNPSLEPKVPARSVEVIEAVATRAGTCR
jgi:hypothetical protein